ncbi:5-(carboxyamino)imidazole ribonucleotide synthase [Denitromonas iodatirespirans]|uniref:N5-carboxyaminoimidazole ribonucleotide synthase n=1 Tax=Denitromonas iodatirespirans TaxID=2795389 RepID=A0A944DE52_DENI1|nr:5-(carboxyamino)imidazole ribonucleotide synthase [Denitromonas iodatirespirans]MBT0961143.1 5-(carboxyamino)imidazole ribonucleotide synthase [Denitromonas iodatirespirans]
MQTIAPILPPATLGMLGGGQLGRFFVHAAHEMGYQVWVLDPDANSPAGRVADRHLQAEYEDFAALDLMAGQCAAVTTEFENVPAGTLEYLAKFIPVRPGAAAVSVCQHRIAEKTFLADNGLPHGPFRALHGVDDLADLPAELFPAILKVARFGYDGKGQATVHDATEALHAFNGFGGEHCVLEKRLPLDCEVSVVLAREANGAVQVFPVAENRHRHGILDVSITPARVSDALAAQARQVACHIAERLGYVGTLAVEFFVSGGALYVNEMAPRPHNSGHATIDANITDQYMQQVRALCGLPLGEPRAHSAAVMVNLLGDLWYRAGDERSHEPDWSVLHAVPNLRLHLYGKHHARAGRKMGHFTVVDRDVEAALSVALAARAAIGIVDD